MGNLTNDMTRLSGEIVSLHHARTASKMNMERDVSSMRAGFSKAHKDMARKTSAERAAFMSGLQKTVSRTRKENHDDITGAHRAWCGTLAVTTAKHHVHTPAVAEKKHEAKTNHVFPDAARGKDMHIKEMPGQNKKKQK